MRQTCHPFTSIISLETVLLLCWLIILYARKRAADLRQGGQLMFKKKKREKENKKSEAKGLCLHYQSWVNKCFLWLSGSWVPGEIAA